MADFTSALYLGMRHPSAALGAWEALTLGRPAALQEAPGALDLAVALARLQGCQAATLLPSTLHLFWDLFGMLAREPVAILIDGGAYPIARWGADRARALGATLHVFPRGAAPVALQLARRAQECGRRPVILADGYCPGSRSWPPLSAYARIAATGAGYLVLDDTQVLGLFGRGGGGSVPRHGLAGGHVIVGASLAKSFGVPLAVLAGSRAVLQRFDACSQIRLHTSPPSVAAIQAGHHALAVNLASGAALRQLLCQRIVQLQQGLAHIGIECRGGCFPVQTLLLGPAIDGRALHAALARRGVNTLLQSAGGAAFISFLLRADHRPCDIEHAVAALHHLHQLSEAA